MAWLLESPELGACEQMALDEALLDDPAVPLCLRFYRWTQPALTFGYFQEHREALSAARREAIPAVVRRPTGGGIVLHRGDVTFSLVFPWDAGLSPWAIYKNIHRAIHAALKSKGLPTRLWSPKSPDGEAPRECFAQPSAMDLLIDIDGPQAAKPQAAKVLGGALRKKRGRGLYQGSFQPPLGQVVDGVAWDGNVVRRAIREGLGREWKGRWEEKEPWTALYSRAQELARSRYATRAWNEKR